MPAQEMALQGLPFAEDSVSFESQGHRHTMAPGKGPQPHGIGGTASAGQVLRRDPIKA